VPIVSAYLIHIDPESGFTDDSAIAEYGAHVGAIVEAYGGRYLVRHQMFDPLEGSLPTNHMTLLEFSSMAQLRAFYDSEDYRPWLELRRQISPDNHLIVVES
jgi:uncharacterized protein (DUF1330 family)